MHRLVIALVTLLGLTGASVVAAFVLLSGVSDRLATLAPASTAAYVNVYLRPSAGQQLELAELIGRLPGFADEASLDAKVDQILTNLLSGTGIDYVADVKPWLGDQLAIAAWPDGSVEGSLATVLLSVKDRALAEEAVARLADGAETETYGGVELHATPDAAYAFLDEALVVGPTPESLHPIVDVAGGADALSERAAFSAAMARIPPDHLASAFVDLLALGGDEPLSDAGGLAAALVAEPAGLRLAGSIPVETSDGASSAGESVLVDWLPADVLAAAVVFDVPGVLEGLEATLAATDTDALGLLDTVRALLAFGLGLDLDTDVLPLLDGETAVGLTGLEAGAPAGVVLSRPIDPAAAASSLARLVDALVAAGGVSRTEDRAGTEVTVLTVPDLGEASYAVVDGTIVIGLTPDDVAAAVAAHASGETLGAAAGYRDLFGADGSGEGSRAFVDIGALAERGVLDEILAGLPADTRDILSHLGALGASMTSDADSIAFHAVLTVPDPGAE